MHSRALACNDNNKRARRRNDGRTRRNNLSTQIRLKVCTLGMCEPVGHVTGDTIPRFFDTNQNQQNDKKRNTVTDCKSWGYIQVRYDRSFPSFFYEGGSILHSAFCTQRKQSVLTAILLHQEEATHILHSFQRPIQVQSQFKF